MSYFGRHWRGEMTLPVAYWINNGLLMLLLGGATGFLMAWISAWGRGLQVASFGVLVSLVVLIIASIWGPVGAWRSATHYLEEGGSALWGGLAKLVVGLGLVGTVVNIVVDVLPQLPDQLRMAAGIDPMGKLEIKLAEDGRSVALSGPFTMGAASRFEQVVKAAPQLRRVEMDSPGGRLYEANEISRQVRTRGLQTRATGDCASACTLVFIAGQQRSLAPKAGLGFHRASVPSHNPLHDTMANRWLQSLYEEAQLPAPFIRQVLQTPASSIWFPRVGELIAASILPVPSMQPDLDAGLLPLDAPLARYRETLAENPLWAELERRKPGVIEHAAQRMHAARGQGLDLAVVAGVAQAQAFTAVPQLLKTAGAQSQATFLAMLTAELRDRQGAGDAACLSLLRFADGPDGGAPPLAQPMGQWMQQALMEAPETVSSKPISAIEVEVLRKELGPDGPERVAVLLGGEVARKWLRGCGPTVELLAAMGRLRSAQRQLALRLMLQLPT